MFFSSDRLLTNAVAIAVYGPPGRYAPSMPPRRVSAATRTQGQAVCLLSCCPRLACMSPCVVRLFMRLCSCYLLLPRHTREKKQRHGKQRHGKRFRQRCADTTHHPGQPQWLQTLPRCSRSPCSRSMPRCAVCGITAAAGVSRQGRRRTLLRCFTNEVVFTNGRLVNTTLMRRGGGGGGGCGGGICVVAGGRRRRSGCDRIKWAGGHGCRMEAREWCVCEARGVAIRLWRWRALHLPD